MKRNSLIRCAAWLLTLCAAVPLAVSCQINETEVSTDTTDAITTAVTDSGDDELTYEYDLYDYDEYEFVILNEEACDWANPVIAPEKLNGESVNDAQYNRKTVVEDRLNITIREEKVLGDRLAQMTRRNQSSGDTQYDVVSNRNNEVGRLGANGYLVDLLQIDSIHFDEPWWDRMLHERATIDDKLFFASSDISLFPFEATWILYFNETLFNNLDIEHPYDLVREGKWTLDAMYNIIKEGTNVNTTEYIPNGHNIYGMKTHSQNLDAFLIGAEEGYVTLDDDGYPRVIQMSEHFYNAASKIMKITSDHNQYSDVSRHPLIFDNILYEFQTDSFLFAAETLGHLADFRNYEGNFGVLPVPKYDEAQDTYISMIATWGVQFLTIPNTDTNLERTGVILDYLAYQSYISLMEPYYDSYLTQKGVRNEDSAQMLSIIRDTRTLCLGHLFGWTDALAPKLKSLLLDGETNIASNIESLRNSVEKYIENTMKKYADLD